LLLGVVLATRLKVPPAILPVPIVDLALVAGLPAMELAPQLVPLRVLPPVIYASAVAMSWREMCLPL
jgi:monovalent cation/hydrogen antiporter